MRAFSTVHGRCKYRLKVNQSTQCHMVHSGYTIVIQSKWMMLRALIRLQMGSGVCSTYPQNNFFPKQSSFLLFIHDFQSYAEVGAESTDPESNQSPSYGDEMSHTNVVLS
ncbi:hypothetical protein KFK09_022051 [Dendrobium nobile]|uniref:Uncharacterized protein n=1 Tax=Dendrobium nobile TaxID=94219 RepID=A0A8T3AHX3_DENNO|nr:hypothetical protein KFK09_022051 [Dendrobium nobile]